VRQSCGIREYQDQPKILGERHDYEVGITARPIFYNRRVWVIRKSVQSASSQHDGPSSNVRIRSDVEPFATEAEAQDFIDRNALRVFVDIR
jgi:hypothetical protein